MTRRGLAAGLATLAIYLAAVVGPFSLLSHGTDLTDLGKLTNHQPLAAGMITASLTALFVLYGLALLNVARNGRFSVLCALGFTALFSLTLIFLYPAMAIDVYNYAVLGHVAWYYHVNPLITPSSEIAGDSFITYAGSWADTTSPYGPIWITVTMLDAMLAGSNVVLAVLILKAIEAVAVVGTAAVLAFAFRDRGPRSSAFAAILFGWNPLVQIELVGNGHNDGVVTFFLVAGLILLARNRTVSGALGIGASVLVKYLTLGAIPLLFLATALQSRHSPRIGWIRFAASAAALLALVVGSYAPFWAGPPILQRIQAVDSNYLSSLPALIILLVPDTVHWLVYPRLLLLAAVGLWQANALRTGRASLARATFEVLFATVIVATHFAGWYLALLVAVAVLTGDRWVQIRMVAFTFATTLTTPLWAYVWWWSQDWMSMTTIHLLVVPLTFVPPLGVALLASQWPRNVARQHAGKRRSYLDSLYFEIRNAYITARSAVGSSN